MLYILWSVLSIGLFLSIIVICFQATRLIREKLGVFAAILFVAGSLSFISWSNRDEEKEPGTKSWEFTPHDPEVFNTTRWTQIVLQNNSVSKYQLHITYAQVEQQNIPLSAWSNTEGFISGTDWVPSYVNVSRTDDNSVLHYEVHGSVKWQLLGITIYSQLKKFSGNVNLKAQPTY